MCMDPSFALVNSPGPSHALFFQSVRYIAFFKREKKFSVYLFSSSSSPSLSSPVTPVFHRFVETHAFVKCDMLLKTPLCACCLLLRVFLCRFFFSCVSFSRKVSIRQNVKTTTVQNLPERKRERNVRVWLGRQTPAAEEEKSSATCWQLDTWMSNQEPSVTARAVWS